MISKSSLKPFKTIIGLITQLKGSMSIFALSYECYCRCDKGLGLHRHTTEAAFLQTAPWVTLRRVPLWNSQYSVRFPSLYTIFPRPIHFLKMCQTLPWPWTKSLLWIAAIHLWFRGRVSLHTAGEPPPCDVHRSEGRLIEENACRHNTLCCTN